MRLTLNSLPNRRKTLTRIIRAYHARSISEEEYLALVYGLRTLLSFWKAEPDEEVLTRIEQIERWLDSMETNR